MDLVEAERTSSLAVMETIAFAAVVEMTRSLVVLVRIRSSASGGMIISLAVLVTIEFTHSVAIIISMAVQAQTGSASTGPLLKWLRILLTPSEAIELRSRRLLERITLIRSMMFLDDFGRWMRTCFFPFCSASCWKFRRPCLNDSSRQLVGIERTFRLVYCLSQLFSEESWCRHGRRRKRSSLDHLASIDHLVAP